MYVYIRKYSEKCKMIHRLKLSNIINICSITNTTVCTIGKKKLHVKEKAVSYNNN